MYRCSVSSNTRGWAQWSEESIPLLLNSPPPPARICYLDNAGNRIRDYLIFGKKLFWNQIYLICNACFRSRALDDCIDYLYFWALHWVLLCFGRDSILHGSWPSCPFQSRPSAGWLELCLPRGCHVMYHLKTATLWADVWLLCLLQSVALIRQ